MIFVVHYHKIAGGAGRKAGSICIGEHYLGPEIAAVIRSRGVAAKQGFLIYYSKGDAIGTKVSVRYRRSGRLSEVVVKRGSTVVVFLLCFDVDDVCTHAVVDSRGECRLQ